MSAILDQEPVVSSDTELFNEFLNHPAKSNRKVDDFKAYLKDKSPLSYKLVKGQDPMSLYLCFYDKNKEFHYHRIQVVDGKWKNVAIQTYDHLEDIVLAIMGVTSEEAHPYLNGP